MLSSSTKNDIKKYAKNIWRDEKYIDSSMELFDRVLTISASNKKLENLSNEIESAYSSVKDGDLGPQLLSLNRFEPFMKTIYYILYPDDFDNVVNSLSLASIIKNHINIMKNDLFNKISAFGKDERVDVNDPNNPVNNIEFKNSEYYHFIVAYCLRNDVSHLSSGLSPKAYHEFYECVLRAYFEICNMYKNEILTFNIKKSLYSDKVIDDYENIGFNYIKTRLNLSANKEIMDKYGVNNIDFQSIYLYDDFKICKIIGYAGVGKSCLLANIQYNEMLKYLDDKNNNNVPVIIPLIIVNNKEIKVNDLLSKVLNVDIDAATNLIKEHKVNLYFDGVNEIRIKNKTDLKDFLKYLENFILEYGKNSKVIVTDRDDNGLSILNDYNKYPKFILSDFTDEEINEYIKQNVTAGNMNLLLNRIKDYKENNALFYTNLRKPFYLSQFIHIFEVSGQLVESTIDITREFIKSLIHREEIIKKDLSARYILGVLKNIARFSRQNDNGSNVLVEEADLLMLLNDYKKTILEDTDAFISMDLIDLMCKMRLLKESSFGMYSFADDSYYEVLKG